MIQFKIQTDSEIPASKQLLDQLQFAIASRQYPPGHRLPSTRQLAQITGLHRNTISKVYKELAKIGLVNSLTGSGIYVKIQENESENQTTSLLLEKYPKVKKIIQQSVNQLIAEGFNLSQAKELFLAEIEWRLRCSALVLITVPQADMGAGQLMVSELEKVLLIPVELVPIEELNQVLKLANSATVVTSRYFLKQVLEITEQKSIRVIPIDIYDYAKELQIIKNLPQDCCLGIVSLSVGILKVAETLIYSFCGEKLLILTAQIDDKFRLKNLISRAHTIISDPASFNMLKKAVLEAREDLIRPPQIICTDNYISEKSINLLKRELNQISE